MYISFKLLQVLPLPALILMKEFLLPPQFLSAIVNMVLKSEYSPVRFPHLHISSAISYKLGGDVARALPFRDGFRANCWCATKTNFFYPTPHHAHAQISIGRSPGYSANRKLLREVPGESTE